MMMNSLKKRLIPILLFVCITFFCSQSVCVDAASSSSSGDAIDPKEILEKWVSSAREQYENLPDQGKFATAAVVGFTTSKVAVNSAVKFVKIAGAAFVATEVLEAAGILDKDAFTETEATESIKRKAIGKIGDIRTSIRRRLDGQNIKRWMETDRMGSLGAAAGAFFGFLL
mmetsp:Transcript_22767/g.49534  ORF Transcript_22767/g.49534 Transcript_22767/m.49534 type:complete len:171 (+) Transcript_22767:155-667(+)|eukprot:CAMPEP_0168190580 /NCGR_PEP_ID=MMETSP0139_2-20121125/16992_1 /TAXON_ID=44445 /ORGANISM="Pseudo-nitzschia australis, Strain 10249 10 AB" /LENGTH=170 /DNA_ID=CAMNT_0008113565 /DNA_START=171 /DNA_END=683 /DNA_ORIENTATION=+